eukprot:UN31452
MNKLPNTVLIAATEDDCVDKMNNNMDKFVNDFIKKDPFLKEVPKEEVEKLKKELEPKFRDAFNKKQGNKMEQLVAAITIKTQDDKDEIVMAASSPEDCLDRMHDRVDKHAQDFVDADDFFLKYQRRKLMG